MFFRGLNIMTVDLICSISNVRRNVKFPIAERVENDLHIQGSWRLQSHPSWEDWRIVNSDWASMKSTLLKSSRGSLIKDLMYLSALCIASSEGCDAHNWHPSFTHDSCSQRVKMEKICSHTRIYMISIPQLFKTSVFPLKSFCGWYGNDDT